MRSITKPLSRTALLAAALAIVGPVSAQSTTHIGTSASKLKCDRTISTLLDSAAPAAGMADVIVQWSPTLSQEAAQDRVLASLGGDVYRHLGPIHATAAHVPVRALGKLADRPEVRRISLDAILKKEDEFTVGDSGADIAFGSYGLTGKGVTVAVLDTGVQAVKDVTSGTTVKSSSGGLLGGRKESLPRHSSAMRRWGRARSHRGACS